MTGRLYIMRHGEAALGYPDPERQLTARGHAEAEQTAEWLGGQVGRDVRLYVSPYVRARQTALPVARALGIEPQVLPMITPEDSPHAVCDWLMDKAQDGAIVMISHMPLVGALTGLLVEGRPEHGPGFPTAAVAELESDVWAAGCASLLRFVAPGNSV